MVLVAIGEFSIKDSQEKIPPNFIINGNMKLMTIYMLLSHPP